MTSEEVQELLGRSHYVRAYREAMRLLDAGTPEPAEAVQLLLAAAKAVGVGLGQARDAADLAVQAVRVAEEAGLHAQAQLARVTAGEALRRYGEWTEAAEWFESFLAHDQDTLADRRYRGVCLYNYGMTHCGRNDPIRALPLFERAAEAFASEGTFALMARAYRMLAWTHLLVTGRADLAEPYIRAAACMAPQLSEEDRAQQITLEARHALLVGDLGQAVALCEEIFAPGRSGVTALVRAEAAMVSAEVALKTGRRNEARYLACLAVEAARDSDEPQVINRAAELMRSVESTARAE